MHEIIEGIAVDEKLFFWRMRMKIEIKKYSLIASMQMF